MRGILALVMHDWVDATIVLAVIVISNAFSLIQGAPLIHCCRKLRKQVSAKTTAVRDGQRIVIASENVVPGDIIHLAAGSLIPADGLLLEAKGFLCLTGDM